MPEVLTNMSEDLLLVIIKEKTQMNIVSSASNALSTIYQDCEFKKMHSKNKISKKLSLIM